MSTAGDNPIPMETGEPTKRPPSPSRDSDTVATKKKTMEDTTTTDTTGTFQEATSKRRPKATDVLNNLTHRFGLKASRVGPLKDNVFHAHDIKVLFSLISDLDKEAVILAANNQDNSAKYAHSLKVMTYGRLPSVLRLFYMLSLLD
jgi:hypothetical protein